MDTDGHEWKTGSADSSKRPQLNVLTSLRFFAAGLVVLFHFRQDVMPQPPWWLRGLSMNGAHAVDFFFVLSGFILTYTYYDPRSPSGLRASRSHFWVARFARIYPAYALSLLLALPAFARSAFVWRDLSPSTFLAGLVCAPALVQAWAPSLATAWNIPAWSLSVEAFFYALFPLIGPRFLRATRPWQTFLIAYALVAISCATSLPHLIPEETTAIGQDAVRSFYAYFPLWHLPTFLFGMACGRAFMSNAGPARSLVHFQFVVGSLLIAILFTLYGNISPWIASNLFLVPLYGIVIQAGARCRGRFAEILGHRVLTFLGEISYAIYVLHIPIFSWVKGFWPMHPFLGEQSRFARFWVYLVILLASSALTTFFVERPMRRILTSRRHSK